MPGTIHEVVDSRSYSRNSQNVLEKAELLYQVIDTEDEDEVEALIQATLPALFGGLLFQDYDVGKQEGPIWDVTAKYARKVPAVPPGTLPQSFDSKLSIDFSTSGSTTHITQSIVSTGYPEGSAPDEKDAIGVTSRGVEGIDVNEGGFEWTETYSISATLIDELYLKTLRDLSWTVNNAEFRGFDEGELLFHGVTGSHRQGEDARLSFTFTARPNEVNLEIGDITIPLVEGHQYVDVRYKDDVDAVGGFDVKVPQFVYVHTVYFKSDFDRLGIGN